jgi:hypothetical protein
MQEIPLKAFHQLVQKRKEGEKLMWTEVASTYNEGSHQVILE